MTQFGEVIIAPEWGRHARNMQYNHGMENVELMKINDTEIIRGLISVIQYMQHSQKKNKIPSSAGGEL